MINGNALLDANGEAVVSVPGWFTAAADDFRYTLTPIGAPGPNLHIAAELANNTFKIAGGAANAKVSWQVSGVRIDPYAAAHPIQVEQNKSTGDAGKYLHAEELNQPASKQLETNLTKPYEKP
jgi:hypothetical protein